ncbi:MAG TPA: DUF2283 domain-containing protein [Nocardioides sp.]
MTPEASYLTVATDRGPVAQTIEINGPDLNVDVDATGRVVGVERIGGLIDVDALTAVLRGLRVQRLGDTNE